MIRSLAGRFGLPVLFGSLGLYTYMQCSDYPWATDLSVSSGFGSSGEKSFEECIGEAFSSYFSKFFG